MKKKITVTLLILILSMLIVSCFGKKEENKTSETKEEKTATEDITTQNNTSTNIFNLGKQNDDNANTIDNLSAEEQQVLINNKIDPEKVSEAIKKAESGDKESIISLAQLYYSLKDMEKVKKYLQIGVNKNYEEAIYNLAVVYRDEGNTKEAEKLLSRLPKSATVGNLPAGAEEYNKGIEYLKSKKYDLAKKEFEKAYNKGLKDADIQIALINKEQKKYSEAVKWLKIANKRGLEGTDYEIGAILFDTGKTTEARPYLIKAYNKGSKNLAMPIAISYDKENNTTEAVKWYKTAAKNGDENAKKIVAEIEKEQKNGNSIAGNRQSTSNSGENSAIAKNATSNVKIEPLQKTESNIPTEKSKKETSVSKGKEKGSYNVGIDEIMNKQTFEYNSN